VADREERGPHGVGVPAGTGGVGEPIVRRLDEICGPDGGAERLVRRLVQSFLDRAPGRLQQLAEAVARGDAPAVATLSHSLQGSALNLGATALSGRCAVLDRAAREGHLGLAQRQLSEVQAAYGDVEPVLRDLVTRWVPEARR
jgi:HPt (histidine-containing phosphotransfer) domain-containing protein